MRDTIEKLEKRLAEEKATKKSRRGRVVIYVDQELFDAYQEACQDAPYSPSRLLEEFIRDYMAKKKKK